MSPTDAGPAHTHKPLWRLTALLVVLLGCVALYLQRPRPGRTTLTYRIGAVDPRFGLGREEAAEAVRGAVAIWRAPVARELFREDPHGAIVIDLVYDLRQEAVDRLRTMDRGILKTQGSIAEAKAGYEGLKAAYELKRDALKDDFAAYDRRVQAFNAEQESLRRHGDATENELRRLAQEREALGAVLVSLRVREQELEASGVTLKNTVDDVNQQVQGQRAQVDRYNEAGSLLKEEYDGGVYQRKRGRQSITIYSFSSSRFLVRVLTHELGHALGIGHGQDPKAIMYPLMQTDSLELAPEDIAALKAVCGVN